MIKVMLKIVSPNPSDLKCYEAETVVRESSEIDHYQMQRLPRYDKDQVSGTGNPKGYSFMGIAWLLFGHCNDYSITI